MFLYQMYGLSAVNVNGLKIQRCFAGLDHPYLTSTLAWSATCLKRLDPKRPIRGADVRRHGTGPSALLPRRDPAGPPADICRE